MPRLITGTSVALRAAVRFSDRLLFPAMLVLIAACDVFAQPAPDAATSPQTVCGLPIPPPATEPPAGSSPVIFQLVPCFSRQGNVSMVEPQTYLHYIHTRTSRPSLREWVPYDESAIASILDDFKRVWATGFVDDLSIEAFDYPFSNGTIGKLIVYNIDERQRIKIVSYEGAKHLEQSKLEEELRKRTLEIRLDTLIDHSQIAKVKGTIAEMLAAEGFPNATVATNIEALPGGPKSIRLTFSITEGPKSQVRGIEFEGNQVFDDGTLRGAMGQNRLTRFVPFLKGGGGTYKETAVEENAERVVQFYRNRGYVAARVGQPQLRPVEDSDDGRTRWLELHIPVTEGHRHRVGEFTVEGAASVKPEYLLSLFKIRKGDVYSEERIRDGLKKVHELYGALGRFEFTAYPELSPRDTGDADHAVDVTLRLQEGGLYLINRIEFLGNTTTKDNVIRRELRVYEGGVFDTEALKFSVRRLNQLGYFKPLEDQKNIQVEKTPGVPEKVDLTLKLEEQNRNQINFGAGMSELNGLFVNGSFSTTNFLGKGETVSIAVETGLRSNNYQASLTEPYVFNRPISIGASVFSRKTNYLLYSNEPSYSEVREGISGTIGMGLRAFTRIFGGYTYEVINAKSSVDFAASTTAAATAAASVTPTNTTTTSATATSTATSTSATTTRTPTPTFLYTLDQGRKVESRVEPAFVYDSVDNPFTPRNGMRLSLSSRVAGGPMGGEVNYLRPEAELVWYKAHTRRTALGLRAQVGLLTPYGGTTELPYYLRYFLGGENQIRGVDLRTVGPINSDNQLTGGNKFVLFNAEYYFDIMGPVRALAFHDAGQAFDETKRLNLRELRTSTGAELRVVLPMFNIPFRLIYAWNFYRDSFQPDRTFKFAVGTTF